MIDKNKGDKVLITAEIDAFRTGLKHKECRVVISGKKVWVDVDDILFPDKDER